jgi:hypothetical protein
MPDEALFAAAAAGRLDDAPGVEAEARRMVADDRARTGILEIHRQWLGLDGIDDVELDVGTYPMFNLNLRRQMRQEADDLVLSTILDGDHRLSSLLTTRTTRAGRLLGPIYGVDLDPGVPIDLPEGQRAGILTSAGMLAMTSHAVHPSPVLRGKLVLERLLCHDLGSPPANANITPPTGAEAATNRERYAEHENNSACSGCHRGMDAVGFGFEHYDAIGRWREEDGGEPVDATGTLSGTDVDGGFDGAIDLADRLAASTSVRDCVADRWAHQALARPPAAADACALDPVRAAFRDDDDLIELAVAIARSDAFRFRSAE